MNFEGLRIVTSSFDIPCWIFDIHYTLKLSSLINFATKLQIAKFAQKKGSSPCGGSLLLNPALFQVIKSFSGSSSVQLDLNFVGQALIVFAQNFNDFITSKVIRQRLAF